MAACAKGGAVMDVLMEVAVCQAVLGVAREKGRDGQEKFAG